MKGLTVVILLVLPLLSYPQGVFTNSANSALQEVISDYPKFSRIMGNVLNADPQSTDYSSKVEIPGSLGAVVTRYSSEESEDIYSWKCVVLETEDFEVAAKKYKELYGLISNSIIKIQGQKPLILSGSFAAPTEEKRFNNSEFQLLPAAPDTLQNLKVELALEYYVTEWKLTLLVYDRAEEELVMD